jgi:cysteine desulfurase/selenocysteine lyase
MKTLSGSATLDVERVRKEFPILSRNIQSETPLIYLDSAATSQKPKRVIESMSTYYSQYNANIHRGIHRLAEEATRVFEQARQRVADFIGAPSVRQVIFTRNTTESINLVAHSWGRTRLEPGARVILTEMEHHSNLIPWQMLAEDRDLQLDFVPVTDEGLLDMEAYSRLLDLKPSLVAFTHMSNVLGTINPAREMVDLAHRAGAIVLIDAAQSIPHFAVNVADLDADFVAFSAHKMCGPTGIGVLYGREELLNEMPPFMGGGDMIKRVKLHEFTPNELPYKFEAGTPAIAEAIGFGEAIEFLKDLGMDAIHAHEQHLVRHAMERLAEVPGVKLLGPPIEQRGGVVTFTFDDIHPHDVAQILDNQGVAVRAGHHCAMPLHACLGIPASTRASFYMYNTLDEIDSLVEGLYKVKEVFA